MNSLPDKLVLLIYCLPGVYFCQSTPAVSCALWAALAVSALADVFPEKICSRVSAAGYAAVSFAVPELLIFLPLLSYDFLPESCRKSPNASDASAPARSAGLLLLCLAPALCASSLAFHFSRGVLSRLFSGSLPPAFSFFYPAAGCVFALLLRQKSRSFAALQSSYHRLRDDDTELTLVLEQRNEALLEKQDNEVYLATLRERNRIAREIHDNVGHMLTRSILMVGALRTVHQEAALAQPLSQLQDTLNQAMDSIRQSVHGLHESTVSLNEALEVLIRDFTFCPVTLHCDVSPGMPRDTIYSLISIAREALVNISRHSNATRAEITVVEHPGFYQFAIRDNGTTASRKSAEELLYSSGIGLANIQSRARALGGHLSLDCTNGFHIYIMIPRKGPGV